MFRDDIEGLRAISVVLVVAFHAQLGVVPGGFVGVDVFFVISGYMITRLLVGELEATGSISLRAFYARRARRLLPLSCVVIIATAIGSSLLLPPLDRTGIAGDIRAAALFYGNWNLAISASQYMADTQGSPLVHFWSLGVEEQFYFLWPLLLRVAAGRTAAEGRGHGRIARRLGIALVAVGVGSFLLSAMTSSTGGAYAFYGLHTRAWELTLGAGLAVAGVAWIPAKLAGWLGAIGLLLIGVSAVVLDEATTFPGVAAIVPCLGAVFVIASNGFGVVRVLAHPVPRYFGRLSYAWYLWHWPCLVFARGVVPMSVAVALSLGLAMVSHHLIEQPIRRSRWLAEVPARSLALGAVAVLLSVLAGTSLPMLGDLTGAPELMTAYQARIDQPRGVERCYATFERDAAFADCTFGDLRAQRAIALVGDSHAHAWFPAIDRWAKASGYRLFFWAKLACPVTDVDVWQRESRRPYTECTSWRANVLERLRTVGPLDAVIVGRSHWYSALLLRDGDRAPEVESEALWSAGMERTLAQLSPLARRVVLLRAVPRAPRDVPACISEKPNDVHHCEFVHDPSTWNDRHIERAEAAMASTHVNVVRIDMTRSICPTDLCPVYTADGTIMFRDHHHLTATFSSSLWAVLGEQLEGALR